MRKFGFNPHVDKKYIYTRSYANLKNLLLLYKIKAFYKTDKWEKLKYVINVKLQLAKNPTDLVSLTEPFQNELSNFSKQD